MTNKNKDYLSMFDKIQEQQNNCEFLLSLLEEKCDSLSPYLTKQKFLLTCNQLSVIVATLEKENKVLSKSIDKLWNEIKIFNK